MKFKFDQIEIDLKIRKTATPTKNYTAVVKSNARMHKVNTNAVR